GSINHILRRTVYLQRSSKRKLSPHPEETKVLLELKTKEVQKIF
ncbi:35368_t:CDS:1, partial [Gigaspora margarita]